MTKSPPYLLCVDGLVRHFRNARFLFMVRNPYAVCEGIYRRYRQGGRYTLTEAEASGRFLTETVAVHVANCLAWQRRNVETYRGHGVFFTYETMCAEPERVTEGIRALVPALADLHLRQRLPVKRIYDEMLTDMNARQIARLDDGQIAAFNRVFRTYRDVPDYFGYDLMPAHP